jgi:hypothetical protein
VPSTAVQEYRARLDARRVARDALTAAAARVAHARLVTFFSGVVLALLAWYSAMSVWWLFAPVAVFGWLVIRHERVLRARELAIKGIGFYERGLARLEDRWPGTGEPGERFRDDRHVYANDLELFGRGSLFELLSLARTRTGEDTLAGWLMAAADPPEIQARQQAVEELAAALDLRECLGLSGADVRVSVNTERLLDWAESPMPPVRALRAVIWFFTALLLLTVLYLVVSAVWWPLSAVLIVQTAAIRRFRDEMTAILSTRAPGRAADFVADVLTHRSLDLEALADMLTHLERARFEGARLVLLHSRLSPLAVGATLHIQDSLLEGRSRFYAEITRIRTLADIAAGPVPLLFLLDELFHGTNSNDRLLGAEGVLVSLLERGASGLITTHDLALTAIADELAPRGANVHFQDSFEEGTITFDYRMRSGPVTRSNALALMRAVGLQVATLNGGATLRSMRLR